MSRTKTQLILLGILGTILILIIVLTIPDKNESKVPDDYKVVCHNEYYQKMLVARFCLDNYGYRRISTAPIVKPWHFDQDMIFEALNNQLKSPVI